MANIAIIGAGVMGSALAVPASVSNRVTLIGTMLDDDIIHSLRKTSHHPGLKVDLPTSIETSLCTDSHEATFREADIVVLGVSSPGVGWALNVLHQHECRPNILALVTKGLVPGLHAGSAPRTYAQHIGTELTTPSARIVGIGGPCIARELALNIPTRVCFASHDLTAANELRQLLQTDTYRIATGTDFTGLEACAALKNFMCIGISAMYSAYEHEDSHAKNPIAALFNQAVHELAHLSDWILREIDEPDFSSDGSNSSLRIPNAFDLAGMGDLHVTVGGGRNSRLGRYLGTGQTMQQILQTSMQGVTVEGVDTGKQLAEGFRAACDTGTLDSKTFPLTKAILDAIEHDTPFSFNFSLLPG